MLMDLYQVLGVKGVLNMEQYKEQLQLKTRYHYYIYYYKMTYLKPPILYPSTKYDY